MHVLLLCPGRGAEYCDQPVCLCVCLSVHEHISGTAGLILVKFGMWIPCGPGSSSFSGVALRYVLPVLWMTSHLTVMGSMALHGQPEWLVALAVGYMRDRGGV